MDNEEPPSAPRKVKFAPKAPPKRRLRKATLPKSEVADDGAAAAEAQELLRRFNEQLGRKGPKVETTASAQVVFGHGAMPSDSIRTYGVPTSGTSGKSSASGVKDPISDGKQEFISPPSTVESDGTIVWSTEAPAKLKKKDYKEPWDYHHSNYPTTLPLRRPYSGDPELLDEAEFGKASENKEYNENTINPALELGLLEESEKAEMFFLQLPATLPLVKRSASAKGKEIAGTSASSGRVGDSKKGGNFGDLPGGHMGKMLVYKSGAIKLKLGDTLHDVSPGVDCNFAQDAVAINTEQKDFCVLGELGKRMVVTPDIDSLLNSVIDLH